MLLQLKKLSVHVLFVLFVAGLYGCDKGPAEEAGEAIDEAIEDAGEAVEDAQEKVEDAIQEREEK